mmetsp:Transcript_51417/g.133620  ORF Transcript_51417/g.133620 Transcript_51417/m.133620 type:complete len:82 (-) Transcript_51417:47-292(-)
MSHHHEIATCRHAPQKCARCHPKSANAKMLLPSYHDFFWLHVDYERKSRVVAKSDELSMRRYAGILLPAAVPRCVMNSESS